MKRFRRRLAVGIRLDYAEQPKPEGLAQRYYRQIVSGGKPGLPDSGDNIFSAFAGRIAQKAVAMSRCYDFRYRVADPERYGVIEFDNVGKVSQSRKTEKRI